MRVVFFFFCKWAEWLVSETCNWWRNTHVNDLVWSITSGKSSLTRMSSWCDWVSFPFLLIINPIHVWKWGRHMCAQVCVCIYVVLMFSSKTKRTDMGQGHWLYVSLASPDSWGVFPGVASTSGLMICFLRLNLHWRTISPSFPQQRKPFMKCFLKNWSHIEKFFNCFT